MLGIWKIFFRFTYIEVPSTRIRKFLKTHLFYPFSKRFASTPGAFSKISPSTRRRCYIQTSLFELRQKKTDNQNALLLSPKIRAHALIRRDPSTRQHENGVVKKIHSGERFRKDSLLVTENAVSVWTLTQNG